MTTAEKYAVWQRLACNEILSEDLFYDALSQCGDLKHNYSIYMTTEPINCDRELQRLDTADYDLCCALLTMLLREDHFCNGSFIQRQRKGQVNAIVERIIRLLSQNAMSAFSEKALESLEGFYVYTLIDPRDEQIFYVGKGTGNRVFSHEVESGKNPISEKAKLRKIREIEADGLSVKRVIVNWGLSEYEAFAAEASLINLLNYTGQGLLTNIVAGHHIHESLSVEDFEILYGAKCLEPEDIQHSIMIIKINKRYRRGMTAKELYDVVRGIWRASMRTIQGRNVEYVFGVYNQLIVAVYKPDEWHYVHEMIDVPRANEITPENFESLKNRVYFICHNYEYMDDNQRFYLHKSIENLKVNQSAQNPITYFR